MKREIPIYLKPPKIRTARIFLTVIPPANVLGAYREMFRYLPTWSLDRY